MTRLVLASGNRAKLVEIRRILHGVAIDLVAMTDLGLQSPPEDGETFEENALIKAGAAAAGSGLWAIADDSGLEVDALGGEPGVRSARYAGEDADDAANNRKLVAELRARADDAGRTARFVCAAAVVAPDGRQWTVRGTMEGRIVDQPRGTNGFGYDPHFVSAGQRRTNGELSAAEKDARSHRGAAFRALRPVLARLLGDEAATER